MAEPYRHSAAQARELYDRAYVAKYRGEDQRVWQAGTVAVYAAALRAELAGLNGAAAILDLGCGTGRYFRCVERATLFVGLDASEAALDEARRPEGGGDLRPRLTCGNACLPCFRPGSFDLVYSIGVFEEHAPFDATVARELTLLLKPGARLLVTVAHPRDVRKSWRRRAAERLRSVSPDPLRRRLEARLAYAWYGLEPARIQRLLEEAGLTSIAIREIRGAVRSHTLAVATKARSSLS